MCTNLFNLIATLCGSVPSWCVQLGIFQLLIQQLCVREFVAGPSTLQHSKHAKWRKLAKLSRPRSPSFCPHQMAKVFLPKASSVHLPVTARAAKCNWNDLYSSHLFFSCQLFVHLSVSVSDSVSASASAFVSRDWLQALRIRHVCAKSRSCHCHCRCNGNGFCSCLQLLQLPLIRGIFHNRLWHDARSEVPEWSA